MNRRQFKDVYDDYTRLKMIELESVEETLSRKYSKLIQELSKTRESVNYHENYVKFYKEDEARLVREIKAIDEVLKKIRQPMHECTLEE